MEALAGQTHLVKAKCNGFQTSLQSGNAAETGSQHPSLQNLRELLDAHAELLARLTSEPPATSSDDVRELLAVSQARERCLGEGLAALGSVALSMRAVLDDVEELMPADSGYLPNVQELLSYGHRLRYTTFATTGLYSGEPAPQQLHFDHAGLWERALAERHQAMAAARGGPAGAAAVDPRAEEACRMLLDNLCNTGWLPQHGFPEPVLAFLGDMPGALDVLNRLVSERFGGEQQQPQQAQAQAQKQEPQEQQAAAVQQQQQQPQTATARLVRDLMLDEESEEDDDDSDYTSDEDASP